LYCNSIAIWLSGVSNCLALGAGELAYYVEAVFADVGVALLANFECGSVTKNELD